MCVSNGQAKAVMRESKHLWLIQCRTSQFLPLIPPARAFTPPQCSSKLSRTFYNTNVTIPRNLECRKIQRAKMGPGTSPEKGNPPTGPQSRGLGALATTLLATEGGSNTVAITAL